MLTVDLSRAGIGAGSHVLDIGCGGGRHAYACAKDGAHVVAIDLDESEVRGAAEMLAAMRDSGEVDDATASGAAVGDVLSLPFASASFDAIIASEVLEHVDADERAMNELVRVLRPGGVIAVSVPRAWPEALNWALSHEYHEIPGGHLRIYRKRQLRGRLERAGLVLRSVSYRHALHSPYWWLRCLVGVGNDGHRLVVAYHRFLVHGIVARPRWMLTLERMLDPMLGKSLVMYLELPT